MKNIALPFAAVLLLLPLSDVGADAVERRTLKGKYVWDQGASGDLRAVFTATGPEEWEVDFHFRFRGRGHVYRGTAVGNLSDGKLEGRVRNENERRTFTFDGEFSSDGTFRGSHAEITGGRPQRTGTLTLSERPALAELLR